MAFYGRKPDDSGGCERARSLTSTHKVLDHEIAGAGEARALAPQSNSLLGFD